MSRASELAEKLNLARKNYWATAAPVAKPVLQAAEEELGHLESEVERLKRVNAELVEALQAVLADCADIDSDSCLQLHVGKQLRAALTSATKEQQK